METLANMFGNLFYVFMLLAFIAVFLLLESLYLIWSAYKSPEAKRIDQRLRALASGSAAGQEASILKARAMSEASVIEQWLYMMPRVRTLNAILQQSGSKLTPMSLLGISAATGLGVFVLLSLFPSLPWLIALAAGAGASTLPVLLVLRKRKQRMQKIEQQLPDALDLMSRALKAGHAFPSALQMVSEEAQDPIREEFRIVHDEINYGVAVPTALTNLAARVPSTDMRYFIIAVLIQRETGGNLTELLGNISNLIRERLKLLMKVRVLAAEGKMSAWILGLLPFVVAGIINVMNPKFMSVLWTDPMGHKMIGAALFMMFLGALWMRKIIRIHI